VAKLPPRTGTLGRTRATRKTTTPPCCWRGMWRRCGAVRIAISCGAKDDRHEQVLSFGLDGLPITVNQDAAITVTLPGGVSFTKWRRLMRVPVPPSGSAVLPTVRAFHGAPFEKDVDHTYVEYEEMALNRGQRRDDGAEPSVVVRLPRRLAEARAPATCPPRPCCQRR
jgi:hypothetical protein